MKERPILFSGPMVRAILEGRKTMTRRAVKSPWMEKIKWVLGPNSKSEFDFIFPSINDPSQQGDGILLKCPYGVPGDRLWVRETFFHGDGFYDDNPSVAWKNWHGLKDGERKATWIDYKADMTDERWSEFNDNPWNWNPSIFMPRWASRITLEVTGVRVERLQEISGDDARAEGIGHASVECEAGIDGGCGACPNCDPVWWFKKLWSEINGTSSWDANPWVWVVEFRRVTP